MHTPTLSTTAEPPNKLKPWYAVLQSYLERRAARRVLMGGLGHAWLPRALPEVEFDVFEHKPHVPDPKLSNVLVIRGDFKVVGSWPKKCYDVIVDDTVYGTGLEHLTGTMRFSDVAKYLNPGGALVLNTPQGPLQELRFLPWEELRSEEID